MIETRDLTKMYGELYALNRLTLKLERGDVYGFIGPNSSRQNDYHAHPGDAAQPNMG